MFVSLLTVTGTDFSVDLFTQLIVEAFDGTFTLVSVSLLGLLAELETVFIVELDSVLMLLDDSTDDELFTGRTPPRWLLAVVDFIDDELATSLLLDSTDDALLEAFIDEALLDDLTIELFLLETSLELFAELLIELDLTLELEAFFDEALLDDLIIELFLLEISLELFAKLLIELDFLLELFKLELFTGRLPPR